jgi:hypothetical protein
MTLSIAAPPRQGEAVHDPVAAPAAAQLGPQEPPGAGSPRLTYWSRAGGTGRDVPAPRARRDDDVPFSEIAQPNGVQRALFHIGRCEAARARGRTAPRGTSPRAIIPIRFAAASMTGREVELGSATGRARR